MVDLKTTGVEVRPSRQMTGGASFNEVFPHDVRVPHWCLLGDVNQGWTVTLATLMVERASIGTNTEIGSDDAELARLIGLVRHLGLSRDPITRQELMGIYVGTKVGGYSNQRAVERVRAVSRRGRRCHCRRCRSRGTCGRAARRVPPDLQERPQPVTISSKGTLCPVPYRSPNISS
jgi:alkylation response protein AidB-like acyl-CoA dehydrogenase